jgi:hypothetical protein
MLSMPVVTAVMVPSPLLTSPMAKVFLPLPLILAIFSQPKTLLPPPVVMTVVLSSLPVVMMVMLALLPTEAEVSIPCQPKMHLPLSQITLSELKTLSADLFLTK